MYIRNIHGNKDAKNKHNQTNISLETPIKIHQRVCLVGLEYKQELIRSYPLIM